MKSPPTNEREFIIAANGFKSRDDDGLGHAVARARRIRPAAAAALLEHIYQREATEVPFPATSLTSATPTARAPWRYSGRRGGVDLPKDDIDRVKSHPAKYYKKIGDTAPWERG